MNLHFDTFTLEGKECIIWHPKEEGTWPIVYLCSGNMKECLPEIIDDNLHMLLFSADANWETDYTPWPASSLPNREPFTGGAALYLKFLTETAKPYIYSHYNVKRDAAYSALMDYSLGGLFALWSLYNTDAF